MAKDVKREIFEQLKKSGYPTELQVQSILSQQKWHVEASASYRDYDGGKLREIDLYASNYTQEKECTKVKIDLAIEVKSLPNNAHWVFTLSKHYGETPDIICNKVYGVEKLLSDSELAKILDPTADNFYAVAEKTINSSGETNKEKSPAAYGALNQACKACYHRFQTQKINIKNEFYELGSSGHIAEIFMPLIVVNTPCFYTAYLDDKEELCLEETQEVRYSFPYISDNYNSKVFLAHIVTQNHLKDYIERLTQKQLEIHEHLIKTRQYYLDRGVK